VEEIFECHNCGSELNKQGYKNTDTSVCAICGIDISDQLEDH